MGQNRHARYTFGQDVHVCGEYRSHRCSADGRKVKGMPKLGRRITTQNNFGTASVEFALILPLLLALLFGIIEFGFVFKDQLSIQQAAREGARIAAVGKPVAEINARITSSATSINQANLTYDKMYRTYNSGTWTNWTALGDKVDSPGQNDAPQGAQVRIRCTYQHDLLTGPLFARLIGRPGATQMPLYAQMVMRRE